MEAMRAEEEAAINHREEDGGSLESADDNQRLAELVLVSRRDLRPKLLAALLDVRFAVKHAVDLPLLHEVGHLEVLITHCGILIDLQARAVLKLAGLFLSVPGKLRVLCGRFGG